METSLALWLLGGALAIISTLVGVIHFHGRTRDDKQDLRADKLDEKVQDDKESLAEHVAHDITSHSQHGERIARLEERSAVHQNEILKLRDLRHTIVRECTEAMSQFQVEAMRRISDVGERLSALAERMRSRDP